MRKIPPEKVEQDAIRFWEFHGFEILVSREDFILGALAFRNLGNTVKEIEKAEVQDLFLSSIGNSPRSAQDEEVVLDKLKYMTLPQRESIKLYWVHVDRPDGSNLVRRCLIRTIEQILHVVDRIRGKGPSNQSQLTYRRKSSWDHIRYLSRSHWLVLVTCILAAATQLSPPWVWGHTSFFCIVPIIRLT